jgi:retron-type reverse transcriptase
MARVQFSHSYEDIISVENLLTAWREFVRGKRGKRDVQEFQYRLMDNILALHRDLVAGTYKHGGYQHFRISDPKPRDIHKASVRDRLLHHTLYRKLYPFFDRAFIADSYSCRKRKGTHRAMNRFRQFAYQVSKNHTRTCWVLKCDIRRFFASIDHTILNNIIYRYISDESITGLVLEVVRSFVSYSNRTSIDRRKEYQKGLPLGNLASQLLVNVYMNEFDRFVKHTLSAGGGSSFGGKARYYVRYADDFVILLHDKRRLESLLPRIAAFLESHLALSLHPDKVSIRTLASGVDFLGWVHFPDHRVLRTSTKRRMLKCVEHTDNKNVLASHLGLLGHGNARKLVALTDEEMNLESDRGAI